MRRAEKRGKELPELLKAALEAQADGKLLVTEGTDFDSAGFIGLAPAEAYSIGYEKEKSATLRSGLVSDVIQAKILDMTHANDVIRECGDTCPTLQARMGTGGNQIPLVIKSECLTPWDYQSRRIYAESGSYPCLQAKENNGIDQTAVLTVEPTYCIQGNTIDRSDTAGANGKGVLEGESYTLNTVDRHAVCHPIGFCPDNSETAAGTLNIPYNENLFVWVVRRLTPRECERLQGFKDDWTKYDTNGNELKDTPRYKALGNSIAIPCASRIFRGIVEAETAG